MRDPRRRSCRIALLLLLGLGATLTRTSTSAQVNGPVASLTGYDWGERWVRALCDNCTKNDTVEYRGSVTIENSGTGDFRIDSVVIAGNAAHIFRIGATNVVPGKIFRPGSGEEMEIFVAPCEQIPYESELRVYYTAPATGEQEFVSAVLRARGIESCIQVSDIQIEGEFDAVTPRSSRKRLHIRSTGTRPVTITDVSLRGDVVDIDEFSLDGVVPLPVTIPVGDTLSLDILFTPTRMESFVREVTVTMTGDFADVDCPGSCSDSVAAIRGIIATADVERTGEGLGGLSVSPNPAGGELHASVTLDRATDVRLRIYDAAGRAVASHAAGRLSPGTHRIPLDLTTLPSGIYIVRVGDLTERVVVVR